VHQLEIKVLDVADLLNSEVAFLLKGPQF